MQLGLVDRSLEIGRSQRSIEEGHTRRRAAAVSQDLGKGKGTERGIINHTDIGTATGETLPMTQTMKHPDMAHHTPARGPTEEKILTETTSNKEEAIQEMTETTNPTTLKTVIAETLIENL